MALPTGYGVWETRAEDKAQGAATTSHGGEPDTFWIYAMRRLLALAFLTAVVAVGAVLLATPASTNVRPHSDSAHP